MKVQELRKLLDIYDDDDEIEVEIYETMSGKYIDTTADITVSDTEPAFVPVLKVDVEAEKFRELLP